MEETRRPPACWRARLRRTLARLALAAGWLAFALLFYAALFGPWGPLLQTLCAALAGGVLVTLACWS
jgi:type IV secretory pathway VirB2 component (pilin)